MADDKPKQSLLKREISFRRRKAKAEEPSHEQASPAPLPESRDEPARTPFWKKEVSFRRRKAAPAPEPAAAEDAAAGEPDLADTVAMPVAAKPAEPPAVVEQPASPPPVEPERPVAPPAPAQPPPPSYEWLTADLTGEDPAGETVPELADAEPPSEPIEPAAAEDDAASDAPERVATPPMLPAPEVDAGPGWTAEPELPPAPATEPPAVAAGEVPVAAAPALPAPEIAAPPAVPLAAADEIRPPVPAAELPPLPEPAATEKKSLLKRDLAFGRKRSRDGEEAPKAEKTKAKAKAEKAPKPQKEPKAAKQPKEKQPKEPRRRRESGAPKTHRRLVGLKIGASQIAAARVINNGSAEVVQLAREELEPGIVVGGELRDPDALASALQEFFKKHKLPRRGIRLGIANNRIGVRTFEIGGIDDPKQLANAIRFRAQEALPIPIEEAVLDYQLLGEVVDAEGQRAQRVLLVVAYRELIDRYVAACRKAGLNLVGIDLEAFALLRVLAAPAAADVPSQAALVAVSIGHERSTFAVSDGRVCEFTRVLEWGGSALNVAIARALDLTPSEAEPIKRAVSLADDQTPAGLTDEAAAKAREAIRRQIQTFARELVSSLQFYQNQPGSLGIGEIVITGGSAHLEGFASELERLIGVNVRVGDPLARVREGKKLREADQLGSLAVAIGLGIED